MQTSVFLSMLPVTQLAMPCNCGIDASGKDTSTMKMTGTQLKIMRMVGAQGQVHRKRGLSKSAAHEGSC
eukprot:1143817-Pelagomonas_calceolata.AAC.1